jgi:hypothetical protein
MDPRLPMRVVRAVPAKVPDDSEAVAEADGPFAALDALDRLAAEGAPADAVILEDPGDPDDARALAALFAERHPRVIVLFTRPRFRPSRGQRPIG